MGTGRAAPSVARARAVRDEAGFALVETAIALVLFALVMACLAGIFIGTLSDLGRLRDRQQATALAEQALQLARSVTAAPDATGCSGLLRGRTRTAVTAQVAAVASVPGLDLSHNDTVWASGACATSTAVVPVQGLARAVGVAPVDPVVLGGTRYTVRTLVGTCILPIGRHGQCVSSSGSPNGRVASMFRVTAVVQWPDTSCAGGACSYTATTLVDPSSDPLFNLRSVTPKAPTDVAATAGESSATVRWTAPPTTDGVTVLRYTATATPAGGGVATTCQSTAPTTTCTVTGLTNGVTYSVVVTASSVYGPGVESTAAQVVPYPAGVMTAARTVLWLDAADPGTMLGSAACTGPQATTTIGCWKDKSPAGNDAVQSTASGQPAFAAVAGRPVPSFDGTDDRLLLTVSKLPTGSTSSTEFVAATMTDPDPTSGSHRSVLNWGYPSAGQARELQKTGGATTMRAAAGGAGVVTTYRWGGAPAIAAAEFTSSSVRLWGSGGDPAAVVPTSFGTGTQYANVGAYRTGAQFWYGQIPEVIVLTGTLTDPQRRLVEEYLARKWSAPITPQAPADVGGSRLGSTAVVWWTPGWDGSDPVTSYTVTATPAVGSPTTVSCTATPCTVTGLTSSSYSVTVTAVNGVGRGPASSVASMP